LTLVEIEELSSMASKMPLNTLLWNPLIFAIFYGRLDVVKGIF